MEAEVKDNTKGVNNFRQFQLDATKKIGFVYGATWLAGIVGILCMAILGWALSLIVPAAKVITDDYYHNHPNARTQYTEDGVYARNKQEAFTETYH